jgi:peroxiredoxin
VRVQRFGRVLWVAFGAVVLLTAGLFVLSRSGPPVVVPPAQAPALARPADLAVVAEVNGVAIYPEQLTRMAIIDTALAALVGAAGPRGEELLDRAIHTELVVQRARRDGFDLPEQEALSTLSTFLATHGQTQTALTELLAANGISEAGFLAYYRRLLLVDAFSRRQAEAADQSVAAYLAALRQDAEVVIYDGSPLALPTLAVQTTASAVQTTASGVETTALMVDDTPSDAAEASPTPPLTATPSPTPTGTSAPTDSPPDAERRSTAVGALAPDFTLTTLAGDTLSWQKLAGAPTVLSFWVTWCGHCRTQTPRLIAAHERYAAQGVQFMGISVNESRDTVAPYVDQQSIPYPIALDSDGTVGARYGVRGFPTTYFLDREGRVAAVHVGALGSDDIDHYIGALTIAPGD